MRPVLIVCLAALGAAACERPSERAAREREMAGRVVLRGLTVPGSAVVSYGTGEEAAEVVLTTPLPPADVIAWYKDAMRLNGWDLRSEARGADGSVTLYAEAQQDRRPLWVRLRATGAGGGTTYSIIGVEVRRDTMR